MNSTLQRIAVVAATMMAVPAMTQVTLTNLGRPGNMQDLLLMAASWDLGTFVGSTLYSGNPGFYWHDGQFQTLPVPNSSFVIPRGLSADGGRFTGSAYTQQGLLGSYIWDRGGSRTTIGGASDPTPVALSPDGQIAYAAQQYWTSGSGWQSLGIALHTGAVNRGFVTEDGRLLAQQWPTIGLWSPGTGFVPIVTVQTAGSVNIMNISPNGSHLVGFRQTLFGGLARVWPVGGNAFDLGFGLSGPSRATSASRDGRVIVGWQYMPIFGPDVLPLVASHREDIDARLPRRERRRRGL